jgi:hypothetical protein
MTTIGTDEHLTDLETCAECDNSATAYAVEQAEDGWGDFYCPDHKPAGWLVTESYSTEGAKK